MPIFSRELSIATRKTFSIPNVSFSQTNSESSMFVWPHKLILKTCGTTTLLFGLKSILRIASDICGLHAVWRCFYSRKAFMFPEKQVGPHRDWFKEVEFLDGVFSPYPALVSFQHPTGQCADGCFGALEGGSAYTVGKVNGDHWLLYLTPADEAALSQPAAAASSSLSRSPSTSSLNGPNGLPSFLPPSKGRPPDTTLEILMSDLDEDAAAAFYHPEAVSGSSSSDGHSAGSKLAARLGFDSLLPDSTLDSFLFTPCGYSANAVRGDRYFSIHVTPEPGWSYASFESNADSPDAESMHALVQKVLEAFRPKRFVLTLFVSREEVEDGDNNSAIKGERDIMLDPRLISGYVRTDRIVYEFDGQLSFSARALSLFRIRLTNCGTV
jgi:S-adenosylmethionine decarboxylase